MSIANYYPLDAQKHAGAVFRGKFNYNSIDMNAGKNNSMEDQQSDGYVRVQDSQLKS